jgi:hypothetical protein
LNGRKTDGGAVIENMGFPYEFELGKGEGKWVPTSLVMQQQKPLLPEWGENRTSPCPMARPARFPHRQHIARTRLPRSTRKPSRFMTPRAP